MRTAIAVARKGLLPLALLLALTINVVQRDADGSLAYGGLLAIALLVLIPDEQRKLQLAAFGMLAVVTLAVLAPRLFDAAARL